MKGKAGQDLVLYVPQGTMIYNVETKKIITDLSNKEQKIIIGYGGKGGFGNAHFTSSTRQVPKFAEKGEPGEEKELKLELKLVADVAFIGLPNVGKSTLLAHVSKAKPKIADYQFTTLVPNLGIVQIDNFYFTACDIPGLIKNAYKGKGLGDKFLRHIERCRLLVHLIDVNSQDPILDYKIINEELEKFSSKLAKKTQIIVLNKIDAVDSENLKIKSFKLRKLINNSHLLFTISAVTGKGLKNLIYEIKNQLEKIPKPKLMVKEKIKVFKPYKKLIKIEKNNNIFDVYNDDLEKLILKTDFSNQEATTRVYRILKKKGVFKLAKKKGENWEISYK